MYGLGVNKLGATNTGDPITNLFANGEQGAWYDISDLSTLFQEDGTTPAVVDGVVGKVLDKSGNGNHIVQTTETKCPILKQDGGLYYLDFDGVDDGLQSASDVDFTGTDEMSVFAGARKQQDETDVIVELSANIGGSTTGAVRLNAFTGDTWRYTSKGTTGLINANATGFTPPITSVLTGLSNISDDVCIIRVNGVQEASNLGDQGTGNYGTHSVNVGARNAGAGLRLTGRIYGLIMRNVVSTAEEIAVAEAYMARKTGVTL